MKKLLLLAAAITLVTLPSFARKQAKSEKIVAAAMNVELSVAIESKAGKPRVLAKLKFKNTSTQVAKVADFLVGKGDEPSNNFFIVFAGAEEIAFTGMMAKRGPPDEEDFVVIQPGKEAAGSFDISDVYAWKKTPTDYQIYYQTTNHFSKSPDIVFKSNTAKFRF